MSKIEIQSPDLGIVELVLNSTDEQGNPVSQTFKLIYEYRAIKRVEDALGIDLKDFQQWKNVKSGMTPTLVHAGLAKYHPEVTLDQVTDLLNPEVQFAIHDAIFGLLFPGVLEQLNKLRAEAEAVGETIPNVQTATSGVV